MSAELEPRVRIRVTDVRWFALAGIAELITQTGLDARARWDRRWRLRPVYCPACSTHFTTWVPPSMPTAPTCVHYLCAYCGGDGRPLTLDAPR